ncbi:hypothetical protein V6N11_072061 [Hibiscus sabdariffa]|uniref:Uncharacterized protein n=1 Tax=Hibiscus sabdariffa TaxID=183260 RepID=A0ABR2U272_9ROSI
MRTAKRQFSLRLTKLIRPTVIGPLVISVWSVAWFQRWSFARIFLVAECTDLQKLRLKFRYSWGPSMGCLDLRFLVVCPTCLGPLLLSSDFLISLLFSSFSCRHSFLVLLQPQVPSQYVPQLNARRKSMEVTRLTTMVLNGIMTSSTKLTLWKYQVAVGLSLGRSNEEAILEKLDRVLSSLE